MRARVIPVALAMAGGLMLSACSSDALVIGEVEPVQDEIIDEVRIGELLFKDKRLSRSGEMACSTCHAEEFGHADLPGVMLPLGGAERTLAGKRSSPTGRYLNKNPAFHIDAHGNAWGGFFWDGRVDTRAEQSKRPFFNPVEMAVAGDPESPAALLELVRGADYYKDLTTFYARDNLDDDKLLFERIAQALEVYQREDDDYNLFDSRYDQYLAGALELSPLERRGLDIFNDPQRGNCTSCHESTAADNQPVFTDFGFRALGVPRNTLSPVIIADPAHVDLGLCRSERSEPAAAADDRYCGMFKTPTLRNVERTAPYFHNAAIASLEDAVMFHLSRDSHPARWYGSVSARYNDLPAQYHANVVQGKPFDGSWTPGQEDMQALLAFLKLLNDSDQSEPLLAAR